MRFMMLIKSDERTEAGALPDAAKQAAMGAFNDELTRAGVLVSAEGFHPTAKGARVRLARCEITVARAPVGPARDQIAGFWMVRVASKAEAIAWAERVPGNDGEIEIRQIYELGDFPVDPAEKPDGWRQQERVARDDAAATAPPRQPGTARFITMLKSDAATESGGLPGEKVLTRMGDLMQEMVVAGALLGGDGLKPSVHGARVRRSGRKRAVVDGPFTESKEMIAGYSTIQVRSLDEAITFAGRWLPIHVDEVRDRGGPAEGEIEVRQLFEASELADSGP